jgi:rubredoxin
MVDPKTTVELHQAYFFICEECGRDVFVRAEAYAIDHETARSIAENVDGGGGDPDEVVLHDIGCETIPDEVTCPHCGARFDTEEMLYAEDIEEEND